MLISASRYSLNNSVISGFVSNGVEVHPVDYLDFFGKNENWFIRKTGGLPVRVKKLWMNWFDEEIHSEYLRLYNEIRPDIVFIYNNQLVNPELLNVFRQKSRIVFFLGDHPLYTPTANYNLHILTLGDHIIVPDSFWKKQLMQMGLKNLFFDIFGFDTGTYFKLDPNENEQKKFGTDIAYIGSLSRTSWAYKRLLFLNMFKEFDFKAYLNTEYYYRYWKNYFPGLQPRLTDHSKFDPAFNNIVYNYTKIGPVETVPSIFNGIHIRLMDLLGSHAFPLFEHTSDFETIFHDLDVPTIKIYDQGPELARHLLANDQERESYVRKMRQRVIDNFSPEKVIKRILDSVI